jgi:endonuclease/exonuclease/phosphatase family metal-dependent hydrolase
MCKGINCIFSWLFLAVALACSHGVGTAETIRVLSYNIHHAEGLDRKIDVERVAQVIRESQADLVALQEVDRGVLRTQRRDLPAELEKLTKLTSVFVSNRPFQGGEYGNAILSRWPILAVTNHSLTMVTTNEPKGFLEIRVQAPRGELRFASTHFDFRATEANRLAQARQVNALLQQNTNGTWIIAGDFNAYPQSETYRLLSANLRDAWLLGGKGFGYTYSANRPDRRIDYIWFRGPLRVMKAEVLWSDASDHLPLLVVFKR